MEEIKVNDYVRTKKGYIGKVISFDVDNNLHCDNIISTMCGENFRWLNKLEQKEQITKHSENILELIEVGDYVNEEYVRATYLDGERKYIKVGSEINGKRTYEKDIKSIVTHQQFNSIKYEV